MSIPNDFLSDLAIFAERGDIHPKVDSKSKRIIQARDNVHLKSVTGSYKSEFSSKNLGAEFLAEVSNSFSKEQLAARNDDSNAKEPALLAKPDLLGNSFERIPSKMMPEYSPRKTIADLTPEKKDDLPFMGENDMVSRKQIQNLQNQLVEMSKNLKSKYRAEASDYTSLMSIVDQEHFLYDNVFQELIRQVSSNMHERGEILSILRLQYNQMFSRIPKHVFNIYNELLVQKEMNRRMRHELVRVQGNLHSVAQDFEKLHLTAQDVSDAGPAQVQIQGDSVLPMNKYLDLYSLRLDRLEKQQKHSEDERFFWMEGVKHMTLKYGKENKLVGLLDFYRSEQNRFIDVNSWLMLGYETTHDQFRIITRQFDLLKEAIILISKKLSEEDLTTLKVFQDIRIAIKEHLDALRTSDAAAKSSKVVYDISRIDMDRLDSDIVTWMHMIQGLQNIYTTKNETIIKRLVDTFKEALLSFEQSFYPLFAVYDSPSHRKEFQKLHDYEQTIIASFRECTESLKGRSSSGDLSSNFVYFQNQIEDCESQPSSIARIGKMEDWVKVINTVEKIICEAKDVDYNHLIERLDSFMSHLKTQNDNHINDLRETNSNLHKDAVSWMLSFTNKSDKYDDPEVLMTLQRQVIKFQQDCFMLQLPNSIEKKKEGQVETWVLHLIKLDQEMPDYAIRFQ